MVHVKIMPLMIREKMFIVFKPNAFWVGMLRSWTGYILSGSKFPEKLAQPFSNRASIMTTNIIQYVPVHICSDVNV